MKAGFKVKIKRFTVKQRGGESPDIQVTSTQYIPIRRLKKSKANKKNPTDYGITRDQFHELVKKASQPIEKEGEDNANSK
jgi:hypothetical protein